MSELSKQANELAEESVRLVDNPQAEPDVDYGAAMVKAAAGTAMATAAMVQAVEAQTKAIEHLGELLKGRRR